MAKKCVCTRHSDIRRKTATEKNCWVSVLVYSFHNPKHKDQIWIQATRNVLSTVSIRHQEHLKRSRETPLTAGGRYKQQCSLHFEDKKKTTSTNRQGLQSFRLKSLTSEVLADAAQMSLFSAFPDEAVV